MSRERLDHHSTELASLDTKYAGKTSELGMLTQDINERLTQLEEEFDEDDEEDEEYEPANIMDSNSNPTTMPAQKEQLAMTTTTPPAAHNQPAMNTFTAA